MPPIRKETKAQPLVETDCLAATAMAFNEGKERMGASQKEMNRGLGSVAEKLFNPTGKVLSTELVGIALDTLQASMDITPECKLVAAKAISTTAKRTGPQ